MAIALMVKSRRSRSSESETPQLTCPGLRPSSYALPYGVLSLHRTHHLRVGLRCHNQSQLVWSLERPPSSVEVQAILRNQCHEHQCQDMHLGLHLLQSRFLRHAWRRLKQSREHVAVAFPTKKRPLEGIEEQEHLLQEQDSANFHPTYELSFTRMGAQDRQSIIAEWLLERLNVG